MSTSKDKTPRRRSRRRDPDSKPRPERLVEEAPQLSDDDISVSDAAWQSLAAEWRAEDIAAGILRPRPSDQEGEE